MIAELTNTPRDLSLHTLFHDSVKVTQAVISSLTKETLDQRFYHDIAKTYRHCQQVANQVGRGRTEDSGNDMLIALFVSLFHFSLLTRLSAKWRRFYFY